MAALRTWQTVVLAAATAALLATARVLVRTAAVAQVFRNIPAVVRGVACVRATTIAAANDRLRVVAIVVELRRCGDQRAQTVLTERMLLGG